MGLSKNLKKARTFAIQKKERDLIGDKAWDYAELEEMGYLDCREDAPELSA